MKSYLFSFTFMAVLFFHPAQKGEVADGYHIIIPGIGYDSFKVDTTTLQDIVKVYGTKSETDTFYTTDYGKRSLYSYRISYPKIGVGFYFHPGQKTIFAIHFVAPFKAKTINGIILNKSTFNDIEKLLGAAEWTFAGKKVGKSYQGINYWQPFKGKLPISDKKLKHYSNGVVTEISVP